MGTNATTDINVISVSQDSEAWIEPALAVLARGGVVAFPTETVYGLAACPTVPGALDKLNAIKGRPGGKPYTMHIADPMDLIEYVPDPPWPARMLARRGWPGPITLVVDLTDRQVEHASTCLGDDSSKFLFGNAIGLRCPDHAVARRLLASCPLPVVAPSANPAGRPSPFDADQVCKGLSGRGLDMLLDGGATRFQASSTVVRVGPGDVQVLRAGPIDADGIDRLLRFSLLFVCTGNTCRSPMAEALGRRAMAAALAVGEQHLAAKGITVRSAGTFAAGGLGPSPEAIEAMRRFSIDLSTHRSRPVTPELVRQSDLIYVMTADHRDFVCELAPDAADRVELLDKDGGIADPLGLPVSAYVECANKMERLIEKGLKERFR